MTTEQSAVILRFMFAADDIISSLHGVNGGVDEYLESRDHLIYLLRDLGAIGKDKE